MAEVKRILVSRPNSLRQEIDGVIETAKLSRCQFLREAICVHSEQYKRKAVRDMMAKGYQEMSAINLTLAEEGLAADAEVYEMLPTLLVAQDWDCS
jgi:CopG family transcriptional regulator / antitoxin EndoAI